MASGKQIVFSWAVGTDNPANVTVLSGAMTGSSQHNSEPIVSAFTFGNWYIKVTVAPGGVTSRTWTLHKNDSATAAIITITGTDVSGEYTGTPIAYSPGDTIRIVRTVSGSPAAASTMSTWELTPTTAGVQIFGFSTGTNQETDGGWFPAINGRIGGAASDFPGAAIIPADGTITAFRCKIRTAAGAGKNRNFKLVLNGVVQDGTSGTPDTTVTIADTDVQAASTFSLAVTAGQSLAVLQTEINAPAGITWVGGNIEYRPTGNPIMTAMTFDGISAAGEEFGYPSDSNNTGAAGAELVVCGKQSFKLKTIRAAISAAPGAGNDWTWELYKNGSDTALALNIGNPDTSGVATVSPAISFVEGDTFSIHVTPNSGPSGVDQRVALIEDAQTSPINHGGKGKKGGPGNASGQFGPSLFQQLSGFDSYGAG